MNVTMQDILESLEARKRDLGRRYNKCWDPHKETAIATEYNKVEYQIRWLCANFEVKRSTKEYLLSI